MPADLRAAHDRNDETLERIYIGRRFKNDTERLEKLFELYTQMTAKAPREEGGESCERKESMNDDDPISLTPPPAGYAEWLAELKTRIHSAQQRATLAVNREMIGLYWQIGRDILARQAAQGWGAR